jgi:dipeptidyl aminopeptidase/acylaminoacyl peptidase
LTEDQVVVVDAEEGRERLVAAAPHIDTDYQESPPLWDPQGKAIYVGGEKDLRKLDLVSGESKTILSIDGDLLNVVGRPASGRYWSPDGGRSLYVAFRKGATKRAGFLRVDLTSGQARALLEEEIFLTQGPFSTDVSPDGKRVVFARQDATHPEDLWIAGVDFAGRRRLTRVNPSLEGYSYGRTLLISWAAGSDRLRGALLLPAGYEPGKRYPLIVNVYGGSSRSNSLFRFGLSGSGVENMQLFATRGFAMLLPDSPIEKGRNAPMSEIARAVLPGVDKVVETGIADPDRLGVMGHSYGGYSTLSLIVQTTRFKAAMASASFSNLISMYGEMYNQDSASIGYLEKGQGGMVDTPWKVRDRYLENSPFFFLDRVETPVLLVHGSLDIPARAEETFVALRRLGKEVEYARYEGEQHWEGTWGYANQVDYWKRMLAWFEEHLMKSADSK